MYRYYVKYLKSELGNASSMSRHFLLLLLQIILPYSSNVLRDFYSIGRSTGEPSPSETGDVKPGLSLPAVREGHFRESVFCEEFGFLEK